MTAQSRKPMRSPSTNRLPRCGSPWISVTGPALQQRPDRSRVIDVELCIAPEARRQALAHAVERELDEVDGGIAAAGAALHHPGEIAA